MDHTREAGPTKGDQEARPAAPASATRKFGGSIQQLLNLQQSAGNRAANQLLTGIDQRPGRMPVDSAVRTRPIVVSRQTPPKSGPVAPTAPVGTEESVIFEPTFEIVPGGLGADKPRTQQQVFRGDTLIFKAKTQNTDPAILSMGGGVVGNTPATATQADGVATWQVVVGNMGVPGKVGEPAELVQATPTLQLAPPLDAGKKFTQTYQFHVVADMAWLSSQCNTAGNNLNSVFLGLTGQIDQAYLNYDQAYQLHKTAVDNNGKRQQLQDDILLGILLAGIGGAAGGKVADLLKAQDGVAVATATGDMTKYMIRLAAVHGPSGGGQQGSDTPDPTASPGTAKAAGVSPERWKALKEKECVEAAKAGVDTANALKGKIDEAWAQGKTDLMDVDPVQLVAPTVAALQEKVSVKSTQEYSIDLWRTWIRTYGITAKENWAGGKTRTDMLAGHTAFTDSKLYDDIHKQVGNALDDEVAALRAETAPDPLTELPD
jgi:hypothetical protein